MIQRRSLSLLLFLMAAYLVAQPGSAAEQKPNGPPIQIEVISVTASNSVRGIDPALKKIPMTRLLPSLFAYTSYHMDSARTQRTICGRKLSFSLPGGIILHVAPIKINGRRIDLIIDMFNAQRPRMMDMHAQLPDRATLILGGPHSPPGMMIVMLNVGIVGSLPPAPPQVHLPPQKLPQAQPSASGGTIPQLEPTAPDTGEVSPISTHR